MSGDNDWLERMTNIDLNRLSDVMMVMKMMTKIRHVFVGSLPFEPFSSKLEKSLILVHNLVTFFLFLSLLLLANKILK